MEVKKLSLVSVAALMVLAPLLVSADINIPDTNTIPTNLTLLSIINGIVNAIWPLFLGVSIIMFIWAGYMFLTAHGDPAKASLAGKAALWGVVGLAVALLSTSIPFIVNSILYISPGGAP